MKIFSISKDGGPESRVWGYFLLEWKSAFSIALLHFKHGSREAYHSHAFNAVSWVLWGKLSEEVIHGPSVGSINVYKPSLFPIYTDRDRFHRVTSTKNTWVLTFRGPWKDKWKERIGAVETTLTHGRVIVDE